jgi:hypothetical protein
MYVSPELIAELDKDYEFMHKCPRLMRIGRFNSITRMCYDIAIGNYAKIGEALEKTHHDFAVETVEKTLQ